MYLLLRDLGMGHKFLDEIIQAFSSLLDEIWIQIPKYFLSRQSEVGLWVEFLNLSKHNKSDLNSAVTADSASSYSYC